VRKTSRKALSRNDAIQNFFRRLLDLNNRKKSKRFNPTNALRRRHFQINSDGSISDLTLARSSGSRGIDRYVLKTIVQRKYNPRPGCPVVESKEMVLYTLVELTLHLAATAGYQDKGDTSRLFSS
jgi:TonB family protein